MESTIITTDFKELYFVSRDAFNIVGSLDKAKRSVEGICAALARTGDVKQCPYGEKCQFNHDLQGYLAQKPPDLPGLCPSLDSGEPCSYGIACRFAGTHKEGDREVLYNERRSNTASNERNSLSKDLQKLLWKNNVSYPKADAQLQALGLMDKAFKMRAANGDDNLVQGHGPIGKGESDVGSRRGADGAIKDSALDTINVNISVNIAKKREGGDDGSEVASTLMSTIEQGERPTLDGDMESGFPPEKKLRVSESEIIGESFNHSDTIKPGNVILEAKEKTNSNSTNDSWQILYSETKLGLREKKIIDFREKLYLAPLTTVGNLPFRRVCKGLGADITCGEMAMCTNLLQGQASEWALLRRHSSEDVFGVQICGSFPDHVARTAELIEKECAVDYIDINMGCPIDLVVGKGAGSCLLTKPQRLEQLVRVTAAVMENPLTVKVRMGYYEGRNCAHTFVPKLSEWGVSAVTIHGRTRQQRYSKLADWAYVRQCADAAKGDLQVIGNGDILSHTDWTEHLKSGGSNLSTCMIARGALIKPWLFREIKEARHWDISSGERLDILKQYVNCGLSHWGSDTKGVETTRHFLLEWLSYMHRYIPVGLLEVVPQRLNWRPPGYFGRNDLETMMASDSAADWVRITELLLGPTPADFTFNPKHKSNAYDRPENG